MQDQSPYLVNLIDCLNHPNHGGMTPFINTDGLTANVEVDDQDTEFYRRLLLAYHICSHQILPSLLRNSGENALGAKLASMSSLPHTDSVQGALNYLVASRPLIAEVCAWHNFKSINSQELFEQGDWRRLGFCLNLVLRMNATLIDYLALAPKSRMISYDLLIELFARETASVFSASCLTEADLLRYWKRLVGVSTV